MSSSSRRPSNGADEPNRDDDAFDSDVALERQKEKIKRLIQDLVSRWYWIIFGLILGLLGAFYYLSKAPVMYSSSARMFVKQKMETAGPAVKQDEEFDLKTTDAMNTVSQQISRFELLAKVAARPDVRALPDLVPPTVEWIPPAISRLIPQKPKKPVVYDSDGVLPAEVLAPMIGFWLDVEVVRNSRHIDVTVLHPSAKVAMVVTNAIAEEYQKEVTEQHEAAQTTAMQILSSKSEEARDKLQSAARALASYTRALALHQSLEEKETLVRQLSRRYKAKHPKMFAAQGELDTLEAQFLEEFESVRKSDADKEFWDSSGKEIDATGDNKEARLRVTRQLLLSRSGVLKSQMDTQNAVLSTMSTQLHDVGVSQESDNSETRIESAARLADLPTSPKRPLIFAAGAIGGLMLGFGWALLLGALDNTFHTVAQLESDTGAAVLASISAIQPRRLARAEAKARKKGIPKPEGAMTTWDRNLVFRPELSATPYAEMYRVLRTSVSLLGDENQRRITLFTSALPGEGKSLTSSNFALAAAAQGRKTLLIDLDLRKPNIHRAFGIDRTANGGGVTECLAGLMTFDEVIYKNTGSENLHLILAGKRAPNPGELLRPEKLTEILTEAAKHYDTIVLDTAPLLAVPDTRIIAHLADHVCLVTRADFVPKRAVFRALETLKDDGTPPSGLVFNGFTEKRRLVGDNYSYGYYRRGYGYGYGRSYGSYGTYGEDSEDDEVETLVIPPAKTEPNSRSSTAKNG